MANTIYLKILVAMKTFRLNFFCGYFLTLLSPERAWTVLSCLKQKGHLPYVLVLAAIGILTHYVWFTNLSIMTYGDWLVDYSEKGVEYFNLPQAWSSNSMGGREVGGVFWPQLLLIGLLTKLHFSSALIERILYLWPIAVLTPICMYYFSFKMLNSKAGAFTSAIVYSFSIPLVVWSTGILTAHMAMTLTPLLLLTYFIAVENESLFFSLLSTALMFVIGFYDFRFLYLVAGLLFLYTVIHFLFFRGREKKIGKQTLFTFLPLITLPILLNMYWLPSFFQPGFGSDVLSRDLFGTSFVSLVNSLFLFVYLWSGSEIVAFKTQPMDLLCLTIPLWAVLGIYFAKGKNKYILFFSGISLVGIFLTKMNHQPFSEVYSWLYLNFPGFNAFRDSTKFYFYIALGYAVLIGSFVKYLENISSPHFWKRVTRISLIVFINAIFLWNAKPLMTGEIRTVYVGRDIPNEYLLLKNFLKQQDGDFRTLYIPRESRWGYYTNQHPKISTIDLHYGGWKSFVVANDQIAEAMLSIFRQDISSSLLNASAVKYVIVPTSDAISDDDFFIYYGNSRANYINALDHLPYLKRVNIGTLELVIYENQGYRPLIYSSSEIGSLHKPPSFNKINYECIQPTECKMQLNNVTSSLFLNFSVNYDVEWKLLAGGVNWNELSSEQNETQGTSHFKNYAALNSYFFDIDYFKAHFPHAYKVNPDGSINADLTLYFKPQNAIKWGALLTVITLFGLLLYIISHVLMKIRFRKNGNHNRT
jgi:hypothetical protein